MRKIFNLFLIVLVSLVSLTLASCKENDNVITVGASPTPHAEILEFIKPLLKEKGYELEVKSIDDYAVLNPYLTQGSIDANYFQHTPYLNLYNEDNDGDLVAVAAVHYEPLGLYGQEISNISEAGNEILIPNDGSNKSRALLLLQQEGLIKLRDDVDPAGDITQYDIVEYNGYTINELAAVNIPSAYKLSSKGTLAVINGNYALSADISISTALAIEDPNGDAATTYANVVAVRSEDINDPKIKALVEVLLSEEVKQFITDTYNGAVRSVN